VARNAQQCDNWDVGDGAAEALAARLRAGDQDAFAQLYAQFSERIYGLCRLLLTEPNDAADATHDVFVLALQRIGQLRDPDRLSAWLFAIARHVCYRRLRERERIAPAVLAADVLVLDDDPGDVVSAAEAADLVWAAIEGRNERDRALIYLHVYEGLDGDELAAAIGVRRANPHSLLHRAKAQLERSVGVLVVTRFGRRSCPTLAALLADWDGSLTPLVRKRVGRHIAHCATCKATRSRVLPLSAFVMLPMSRMGRAHALEEGPSSEAVELIALRHALANERWRADGFPPLDEEPERRRRVAILVGIAAVGVAVLGFATMTGADQPDARSRPGERSTPTTQTRRTTTTSTTRRSTTTTTPNRVSSSTVPRRQRPVTAGRGAAVTIAPPTTVRTASPSPTTSKPSPPTTKPAPPTTKPSPPTTSTPPSTNDPAQT
jgi:RNA polymerase sigma factor (sigma-70 family)